MTISLTVLAAGLLLCVAAFYFMFKDDDE